MKQIDLSQLAEYHPDPPEPSPDPEPNTAIFDGVSAQALNNGFIARQHALLHDGPDAFYAKRGADALAATPSVLDQLKTLRDEFADMPVNARQSQILSQALDNHLTVSRADIVRHADLQQRLWQNTVAQDRINLLKKQAGVAYDDPNSVANYAGAGRSAALHQASLAGFDSDSPQANAHAATVASAIWRSGIEAALAKDATRSGIALHGRAGGALIPVDSAILAPQIEGAREREIGRAYAANIPVPESAPGEPFDPGKSLADLDTAYADATARNKSDWADNDSQRATNQHFIDVAFGQGRQALQARGDQIEQEVTDWLASPSPDGRLPTTRPPLALWTQLSPERQKALDAVLSVNARSAFRQRASNPNGRGQILSDAEPDTLEAGKQYAQVEPPREVEAEEDVTPAQALRIANFQSQLEAIRERDPNNRELSFIAPRGWVPDEETLKRVHNELTNVIRRTSTARGITAQERVCRELGYPQNSYKVYASEGASVPDILTDEKSIEIKDRAYVALTRQLRIQAEAARNSGREAVLMTGEKSGISSEVPKQYRIFRRSDLGPQEKD